MDYGVLTAPWPPVCKTLSPPTEPSFTTKALWCLKSACVSLTDYIRPMIIFFEIASHYVTQADLELATTLPQFAECGDYRHALHQATSHNHQQHSGYLHVLLSRLSGLGLHRNSNRPFQGWRH